MDTFREGYHNSLIRVPGVGKRPYKVPLRLLDTYASKIAKICDLKTFWPLIQLINHLFKIRQKAFIS